MISQVTFHLADHDGCFICGSLENSTTMWDLKNFLKCPSLLAK